MNIFKLHRFHELAKFGLQPRSAGTRESKWVTQGYTARQQKHQVWNWLLWPWSFPLHLDYASNLGSSFIFVHFYTCGGLDLTVPFVIQSSIHSFNKCISEIQVQWCKTGSNNKCLQDKKMINVLLTSIWMKAVWVWMVTWGVRDPDSFCLLALPSSASSFHSMFRSGCASTAIVSTFLPVGSREEEVEFNLFKSTHQNLLCHFHSHSVGWN